LLLIFQQCDQSTLAALVRVSYDFLVTCSDYLYEVVNIRSIYRLGKLFCERREEDERVRDDELELSSSFVLR